MRSSTYRMRPDRFLGLFALGLIILGLAAVLWGFGAADAAITALVVLGGLVTLAGLWVLARPPLLARLDDDGVQVRGVRTRWADVTAVGRVDTTQGKAIAIRTARADDTTVIPLGWVAPGRAKALEAELSARLDAANGYTPWDGTAGGTDDPAE